MTAISLVTVTATCPHCGEQRRQIDATREHAVEVVTAAMDRHITEAHANDAGSAS